MITDKLQIKTSTKYNQTSDDPIQLLRHQEIHIRSVDNKLQIKPFTKYNQTSDDSMKTAGYQ